MRKTKADYEDEFSITSTLLSPEKSSRVVHAALPEAPRELRLKRSFGAAGDDRTADDGIERRIHTRPIPLSCAQERIWILDQLESKDSVYHQSATFRIRGPLDAARLERCLSEIVR